MIYFYQFYIKRYSNLKQKRSAYSYIYVNKIENDDASSLKNSVIIIKKKRHSGWWWEC